MCHRKNGFLNSYHDPKFAHALLFMFITRLVSVEFESCKFNLLTLLRDIYIIVNYNFFYYRIITASYLVSKQSIPPVFPKLCVYLFLCLN